MFDAPHGPAGPAGPVGPVGPVEPEPEGSRADDPEPDRQYEPPALTPALRALDALVEEVRHARAAVAAAQAREAAVLARAVGVIGEREAEYRAGRPSLSDIPVREVVAELGAMMRVGDRTVHRRIGSAYTLVERFTTTFAALAAGEIDQTHAAIICDEGSFLDDEKRAEYEGLVVPVATIETAGRLREIAAAIAARLDPEAADECRRANARSRGVNVYDVGSGLARLVADLPAHLAHAILDRLTEQARLVQEMQKEALADRRGEDAESDAESSAHSSAQPASARAVEPRSVTPIDHLRADLLADMLLTGQPTTAAADPRLAGLGGIRATLRVTIPVTTLTDSDDVDDAAPALLDGIGPICAAVARYLAGQSPVWDRVVYDLPTGAPLGVDRYRPSQAQRRFLQIRDEHCRFPGCRRAAESCDLDHNHAAADGGPTCIGNLGHFCRRHHTLKHATAWRVEQHADGAFRWTSPTGRVYDDHIPETLRHAPHRVPRKPRPPVADAAPSVSRVRFTADGPPDEAPPF